MLSRGALNPSFSGRGPTRLPEKLFIVVKLVGFVLRVDVYILTVRQAIGKQEWLGFNDVANMPTLTLNH